MQVIPMTSGPPQPLFIPPARNGRPIRLSPREAQVLGLVASGYNSKEIASTLCRSKATVESFVRRLMDKLDARSRPHLVALAFTAGLLRHDAQGMLRTQRLAS